MFYPSKFRAQVTVFQKGSYMNFDCLSRMRGIVAFAILAVLSSLSCPDAFAQVNVLTNKMDNSRSGLNPSETLLTPSNVTSNQFGKLYAANVDGYVSAQPLYMSNVLINGGTHNVVFVATQHDSVYAFDADTGTQFWQRSFINPSAGIIPVPVAAQGCGGVTKFNEVGIVGTPAIDAGTGTLYVSAKTQVNGTSYVHTLYALDITTGWDKLTPVSITGTSGSLTFDTKQHIQRPGLLLSNGTVYIAFGSNGCDLNARGWLFAYDASNLQQQAVMTTQPDNSYGSSVWQGGVGPAADSAGNVYLSTANGLFQFSSFPDLGDSVLKLSVSGTQFTVADSFTPFDQATLAANDLDLGSGGDILLPDQTTNPPHLMVTSGKNGAIYLLNRDFLGGYNPTDNSQIVQYIPSALLGEFFGSPLYWNNLVYFLAHQDYLRAYSLIPDGNGNTLLSTAPVDQTVGKLTTFGLPVISANGTTNGIVWLVRNVSGVPVLSAYNASRLFLLYDSGQAAGGRDSLGTIAHFATPIVANGRVFAATQTQLVAYGLFPALTVTAGNNQTCAAGTMLSTPLTITAVNPYTGSPISGVTATFADGNKGGTFGSPTVTTDSNGVASTTYTCPNKPQSLTITATSAGYAPASFSENDVVGPVATLSVVSGGKQVGVVGTTLLNQIVVKAKDSVGNVVPGASISFSDNANPTGTFSPNPATTDSTGQVRTSYTLPTVAKFITVTAKCGNVSVNISEQSVPGSPASFIIFQGNNQVAHPNNKLAKALIVLLTDQYGNGISGATVNFMDNGAGGTFSIVNPVTTTVGKATTVYTTGPQTGTVTITASYSTFAVNFTETVQ